VEVVKKRISHRWTQIHTDGRNEEKNFATDESNEKKRNNHQVHKEHKDFYVEPLKSRFLKL
jgi:hypothetical protein